MENFLDMAITDSFYLMPLNLAEPITEKPISGATPDKESALPFTEGKKEKTLEDKLKEIRDKLEDLRNLQLLNQLDIINLKNQIEAKRLVTTGISQEEEIRLKNIIKLSKDAKELEKIRKIAIELQSLKEIIKKKNVGTPQAAAESVKKELSSIQQRLAKMESKPSIKQSSPQKQVPTDTKAEVLGIKNSLNDLIQRVTGLETRPSKPAKARPVSISIKTPKEKMTAQALVSGMDSLRKNIDILTKRVNAMTAPSVTARMAKTETRTVPEEFGARLEELNRKINALSKGSQKTIKPVKVTKTRVSEDELDELVKEIDKMHDEINHVLELTKLDEVEKMIKRNRSIEGRLKKLITEMHGIKLLHPLREYKKKAKPELKVKIKKLENQIKTLLKKSKPLKEHEKIKYMERKIENLEDEIDKFKKILRKQRIIRKGMVRKLKKRVIKLHKTY